jgi:sulfide:quinone oxidoreductase
MVEVAERASETRLRWRGRFRVLIAGAGPAGVEAALTLERLAGERVTITFVAPERFVHLPPTVLSPFAVGDRVRVPLAGLAGTNLRDGRVVAVDVAAHEVRTSNDEILAYDALLVAVGGVQRSPFGRALAYGTPGSEDRMHGLIQDLEDGYVKRVAFVVPPAGTWPLPVYELALMTAARAYDMCDHVELSLVTPEASPLEVFGAELSRDVAWLLSAAGINVRTRVNARMSGSNTLELHPGGERLDVDRVVTLPILDGPTITGLPRDPAGFLPVDAHGRLAGAPGVYAAGDATDFAIKQGGIACQQADAAAEAIAAEAGVAIEPAPFVPTLRGLLKTERDSLWLERNLRDAIGSMPADGPRVKFAGRELSCLLHGVSP